LPLPFKGSPETVTAEAESRVGPTEANVADINSLANCVGSFMSTREVNRANFFPDVCPHNIWKGCLEATHCPA
jgi:hypothetical protein